MNTDIMPQFLKVFDDYINMCHLENWPQDDTTDHALQNAFEIAKFIEKCLEKLRDRNLLDDFLSQLDNNVCNLQLKYCLADPPKYILNKIVCSNTNISVMDKSFHIFDSCFGEKRLESCLTQSMVESASISTLFRCINCKHGTSGSLTAVKAQLFLLTLNHNDYCEVSLLDMLKECDDNVINLIMSCLINTDSNFMQVVDKVRKVILEAMTSRSPVYKNFWRSLFKIEPGLLVKLCHSEHDIMVLIVRAMVDCSRLLKKNIVTDLSYVDLSLCEIQHCVHSICSDQELQKEFTNIAKEIDPQFLPYVL